MLRKIISFIIANFFGTIVDTAVLWICSHFLFESYTGVYIISPVISFECAVTTNFLCSYFYIWRGRVNREKSKSFLRYYWKYNLSCTGGFLIKMGFLLLTERVFRTIGIPDPIIIFGINVPDVVICNLIALCFSGVFNFAMGEWVIFRKKK